MRQPALNVAGETVTAGPSCRRLLITAPGTVELIEQRLPALSPTDVYARTVVSGISHGTEVAWLRGQAAALHRDWDVEQRFYLDGPGRDFPVAPGYESIARVAEIGSEVTGVRVGDLIALDAPHADGHLLTETAAVAGLLPAKIDPERAVFLILTRVALGGVHDAALSLGDIVVIVGLGTVGLLAVQQARLAGARVIGVDSNRGSGRGSGCALSSNRGSGRGLGCALNSGGVSLIGVTSMFKAGAVSCQRRRVCASRRRFASEGAPSCATPDFSRGAMPIHTRCALQSHEDALELKRIQRELGITFVHVTHDQEEAITMAEHLAVMRAGRRAGGLPVELYERPASEFVASFLGQSNLLDAKICGHDGEVAVVRVGDALLRVLSGGAIPGSASVCARRRSRLRLTPTLPLRPTATCSRARSSIAASPGPPRSSWCGPRGGQDLLVITQQPR